MNAKMLKVLNIFIWLFIMDYHKENAVYNSKPRIETEGLEIQIQFLMFVRRLDLFY